MMMVMMMVLMMLLLVFSRLFEDVLFSAVSVAESRCSESLSALCSLCRSFVRLALYARGRGNPDVGYVAVQEEVWKALLLAESRFNLKAQVRSAPPHARFHPSFPSHSP